MKLLWCLALSMLSASCVDRSPPSGAPASAEMRLLVAATRDVASVRTLLDTGVDVNARDAWQRTALHRAAERGKIAIVELLLKRGADPNARDQRGQTPLSYALVANNADLTLALKKHGARYGWLAEAAHVGDIEGVKRFLDDGVSPNGARDRPGLLGAFGAIVTEQTPLYRAARKGHLEVVKMLVARGAEVNPGGVEAPFKPLGGAYRAGREDIGAFLLSHGARVSGFVSEWCRLVQQFPDQSKTGFCALEEAMFAGDVGRVRELLDMTPISTSLLSSLLGRVSDPAVARLLIERGGKVYPSAITQVDETNDELIVVLLGALDIDKKGRGGKTLLHRQAERGEPKTVKLLLKGVADPNVRDSGGGTALHTAAVFGRKEVAAVLLQNGASHDIFSAAALGALDEVKRLLKKKPDLVKATIQGKPDFSRHTGGTDFRPIHWAAAEGQKEVVEFLLAQGADANSPRPFSPLYLALREGRTGAVAALLAAGANTRWEVFSRTPLFLAAQSGKTELVKLLLENRCVDVNVNGASKAGCTALHAAAATGLLDVATILLEKGAQVDVRTKKGATPLHVACQSGNPELVELLIARGADVQTRLDGGWTPLHCAAGGRELSLDVPLVLNESGRPVWRSARETVELLLVNGVQVNVSGDDGRTPLHLATQSRHREEVTLELVALLVAAGADVEAKSKDGKTARESARTPKIEGLIHELRRR